MLATERLLEIGRKDNLHDSLEVCLEDVMATILPSGQNDER